VTISELGQALIFEALFVMLRPFVAATKHLLTREELLYSTIVIQPTAVELARAIGATDMTAPIVGIDLNRPRGNGLVGPSGRPL
jgi:hypothetical protein